MMYRPFDLRTISTCSTLIQVLVVVRKDLPNVRGHSSMSITTISVWNLNFSNSTCTFLSTLPGSVVVSSTTHIIVYVGFILRPLMFLKVANIIKLMLAPKSHRASPR